MNIQKDENLEAMAKSKDSSVILKDMEKYSGNFNIQHLNLLLSLRKSNSPAVSEKAIEIIGSLLKNHLVNSYSKISDETRKSFIALLKEIDPDIAETLKNDLRTDAPGNKIGQMQLLAQLDSSDETVKIISALAWENDIKVRASAVKILGTFTDIEEFSKIIRFLYDNDPRVVANTIETLEAIGNQNVLEVLMRFRKHAHNRVRANALKALWNLGHREIYDDTEEMLLSENENMRASATWLIGQIGSSSEKLVNMLEHVINDESPLVKSNVVRSCNILGTPRALELLTKVKVGDLKQIHSLARHRLHEVKLNKDSHARASAVKVLGTMINPKDLNMVLSFLNDPDQRVVANTLEVLEAIGGFHVIEYLKKYRDHRNNRVRANAIKALWKYGIRDVVEDLKIMLLDKKELMRASAVWVIGEIGREDFRLRNLLELVEKDTAEIVRRNVLKAKRKLSIMVRAAPKGSDDYFMIEVARFLMNKNPAHSSGKIGISKTSLVNQLKEDSGEKIGDAIEKLTKAGILSHEKHEDKKDYLLVGDPEVLKLFLEFYKDPLQNQIFKCSSLSDSAFRILNRLPEISKIHGTSVSGNMVLQTKFLFPEMEEDNEALDSVICELEAFGVVSVMDDRGERALQFHLQKIEEFRKVRFWISKFSGILYKK